MVLAKKEHKLAGQLSTQYNAEIGWAIKSRKGTKQTFVQHSSGLSTQSRVRNNCRSLPVIQMLLFSAARRKALDKRKLRKSNSRYLSTPARGGSITDCPRCQRREGSAAAALHTI